jgi:hypothetical protein
MCEEEKVLTVFVFSNLETRKSEIRDPGSIWLWSRAVSSNPNPSELIMRKMRQFCTSFVFFHIIWLTNAKVTI